MMLTDRKQGEASLGGNQQVEKFFSCPYCWEMVSMLLDLSVEEQRFVEDCENCCHPIEVSYHSSPEGALLDFAVARI